MNFSEALEKIKGGARVAQASWPRGMFVYLVPAASYPAQRGPAREWAGEGAMIPYAAYFACKEPDDVVSPWIPDTRNILADDWLIASDLPYAVEYIS